MTAGGNAFVEAALVPGMLRAAGLRSPGVRWLAAVALALPLVARVAAADDAQNVWAALAAGGHIALIRHGNAPPGYGGDPPGFRFDDCKTQRNLDGRGRAQAAALGEAFRNHGVRVERILSSPVCRCMDTAALMAVGRVESSYALVPDRDPANRVRLQELKALVSAWSGPGTLVLVTHGFTIQPLVGLVAEQAEVIVLRPAPAGGSATQVVGRIPPPR
jgi:phosphohistidine phosphatase SixA